MTTDCEAIRVAAMALADGEESSLQTGEIESHLINCKDCREEIEQMHATNQLLSSQKRVVQEANLWPMIGERLQGATETKQPFRWRLLLLFGIPLFGYKLFMLGLQVAPSLWSKLFPVVLMIAVFAYLKANPFKINSELTLKGESTL